MVGIVAVHSLHMMSSVAGERKFCLSFAYHLMKSKRNEEALETWVWQIGKASMKGITTRTNQ